MKVFVIDDDEISLLLTQHLLQLEGIEAVETFAGADKALKYLQTQGPAALPDAILLDLNMPVLNGWEFLDALAAADLARPEQCKIYILTSSIDPADAARSRTYAYVQDLFHKPLQQQAIMDLKRDTCMNK